MRMRSIIIHATIAIMVCYATNGLASEDCPECWEPNDPTLAGSEPCKKMSDHVIDDCVSKEEQLFSSGNQCFSQWRVYWNERFGFTPPGGVGTGSGSMWYRQPEVVMERTRYSVYICVTESEVCEDGEKKTKHDDGVFSKQETDSKEMEVAYGEWEPYVQITIHWFFGQIVIERPPRRDPQNPNPCNWKTPVPCICS